MGSSVVVLVEGASDARALDVLAARRGLRLPPVVVMQGITNLRTHLDREAPDRRVLLLHDARERPYVARVVGAHGRDVTSFVCDEDLEHELLRALGTGRALRVVAEQGHGRSLERLAGQPAQRDRTTMQHLRRFLSAHSGHKLRYAGHLAEALDDDEVPAPLAGLLDALAPQPGSGTGTSQ